jgi:hypothetical protein
MRQRTYISQSFALTEEQVLWLEGTAKFASAELGVRVSMSELMRLLIDNARGQTNADASQSETSADGQVNQVTE